MTINEFIKQSNNPIVSGGYRLFFIAADSGVFCSNCTKDEQEIIIDSMKNQDDKQWEIIGSDVNWEDTNLYCSHCWNQIKSEYV